MRKNRDSSFVIVSLVLIFLLLMVGSAAAESKISFMPDDTIAELRAKIAANGYNFTVAPNWVTRLSVVERARLLSRRMPLLPDYSSGSGRDFSAPLVVLAAEELPANFDWRSYNGHSYIGPVRDQGQCGSCYAFGACAAAEGSYNVAMKKYDGECLDLSEAFLAFCLDNYYDGFDGCDGSDYDYDELTALVEKGVCLETAYPYIAVDEGCAPGSESAPRTKFAAWHRIPCGDIAAIKSAIMTYGVIDVAVNVTSAFEAYKSGIFSDGNTDCDADPDPCYYTETNHCVALVGWQDTDGSSEGYWILRNSWGTDWGESGYMKISYRSAHVACEGCYLVYNGVAPEKKNLYVNYDNYCNGLLPCYPSVVEAYSEIVDNAVIKIRSGYLYCQGGLTLDQDKIFKLSGGWNEAYASNNSFSYLYGGPCEISRGTLVAERLIIGDATAVCRSDNDLDMTLMADIQNQNHNRFCRFLLK